MLTAKGIANNKIKETPIAVVDLETTGLTPGFDRVVEISVFKKEPGKSSCLAFDTLVNPRRPVSATEIHGITDEDVKNAPTFNDIAGDFVDTLSGCVVAAYNVYFDIKFLECELQQTGVSYLPPHFCLMYMRPLLNLGHRCSLETACYEHGINFNCQTAHIAASDAEVSAKLMEYYLNVMSDRKISTFGQLSRLKSYKFLNSFIYAPLPKADSFNLKKSKKFLSRAKHPPVAVDPERQAISKYWDSLRTVLADLDITEQELKYILDIRRKIHLPKENIRMLHAKAFASVISQFISDRTLDDKEVFKLKRLFQCLSKLGWAPGE
jgi:DNA polymerase III epsilon subunit family exonuclease